MPDELQSLQITKPCELDAAPELNPSRACKANGRDDSSSEQASSSTPSLVSEEQVLEGLTAANSRLVEDVETTRREIAELRRVAMILVEKKHDRVPPAPTPSEAWTDVETARFLYVVSAYGPTEYDKFTAYVASKSIAAIKAHLATFLAIGGVDLIQTLGGNLDLSWTPTEHTRFLTGFALFSNDLPRLAKHIATKNVADTKTHADAFFLVLAARLRPLFHAAEAAAPRRASEQDDSAGSGSGSGPRGVEAARWVPNKRAGGRYWTEDEHQRFLEGLAKYARDLTKVAEHVGSRTVTQVRTHYQKFELRLKKEGVRERPEIFARSVLRGDSSSK